MLRRDGAIDSAPLQILRADGEVRYCLVSTEVFAVAGQRQAFSIIRDVSEQLRANSELRSGYEALAASVREQARVLSTVQASLARADRELQGLASSVSHDLRAPLRAIRGFSGLLKGDLEAGHLDEAVAHIQRIDRAAQRMDEMIDALTRLARAGHGSIDRSAVDMAQLAREAWALVTATDPARHVALAVGELPPAVGDRPLLAQVWQNLLANAFKYTARAAVAKVGVDAFLDNGRQWFRVTDNGAGFDMSSAGHLFEPFRRLHSEHDFPGTGIGLSVVRRIVLRHGGDIRARGNLGVGAVFEFTLDADGVFDSPLAGTCQG